MKVTTVRFGADVWRLLEAEAALAGVSASQYIREAALARAAAAAAVRGEDPLTRLAGGTVEAALELRAVQDARRRDNVAAASRGRAAATRSEVAATAAQAQQAIRRARELAERSAKARERPSARSGRRSEPA